MIQQSPVMMTHNYVMGGAAVGNTQHIDAFRRAEFWADISPTGNRYHTMLSPVRTLSAFAVNVPSASGKTFQTNGCGGKIGVIDINWFNNFVVSTILPSLAGQGVAATTFPMLLLYNVVMSDGDPTLSRPFCCYLGYHGATGAPMQTYSPFDY